MRENLREVVCLFKDHKTMELAVDELRLSGFEQENISLLADKDTVAHEMGQPYKNVDELEDDPEAPRITYVSTEAIGDLKGGLSAVGLYLGAVIVSAIMVVSSATLTSILFWVILGGFCGGMFGYTTALMINSKYANNMKYQEHHGGILLWVRTLNTEQEVIACKILLNNNAHDVHLHGRLAA